MTIRRTPLHSLYVIKTLTIILGFYLSGSIEIQAQISTSNTSKVNCNCKPKVKRLKQWFKEPEVDPKYPHANIKAAGIFMYDDRLFLVSQNLKNIELFTFDFKKKNWKPSNNPKLVKCLEYLCKGEKRLSYLRSVNLFQDTLIVTGSMNPAFHAVDINSVEKVYDPTFQLNNYTRGSQITGFAFSYPLVYMAYHSLDYKKPIEETQRLIAFDVRDNSVAFNNQLHLFKDRNDPVQALASSHCEIWHMKGSTLVQMDAEDGEIMDFFTIEKIGRPKTMIFHDNALWVVNHKGGLYEIPMKCKKSK